MKIAGQLDGPLRAVLTGPFGLSLLGVAITIPLAIYKRPRLATNEKANSITEAAILFVPTLILGLQVIIPLRLYGLIQSNIGQLMLFVLATVFFLTIGNTIGTTKYESPIGLRNKWTLSDPAIWVRTHRFLGRSLIAGTIVIIALSTMIELKLATFLLGATAMTLKGFAWLYARSLAHSAPATNN